MPKYDTLVTLVKPDSYEVENHFYPKVLNANLHPMVRTFMTMSHERIARRYCHLHPTIQYEDVITLLKSKNSLFRWGGADLFQTTDDEGRRQTVVIETNSSPSGQKSMPLLSDSEPHAGYERLMQGSFIPLLNRRSLPQGDLAVLYDKNPMETTGYAATLADLTGKKVYHVPFFVDDPKPPARFTSKGVLEIKYEGKWHPIRAALKYVTQRPWTRIPPLTKTFIFNPVVCCLAGGRNKMMASKAYDLQNAQFDESRLQIQAPETIWDVQHEDIPLWVNRMGGIACIKNPYSNAGQGVWTVTSPKELETFMQIEQRYDRFIVQSLIGNRHWSSKSRHGFYYHVGTMPDRHNNIFVFDIRFMVGSGPEGFFPVSMYARRARKPLVEHIDAETSSWDILGTNLSVRLEDGGWKTESNRLMLMDQKDFNKIGFSIDGLIEAYIQTVLSVKAIDTMSKRFITQKKKFRRKFFRRMNPDPAFVNEICKY
ncbi:MAG: hypothetical protein PF689_08555 [Deltaproteobacteria bacterium]|jgi:hypothetical protein|nr:hypothetical protein [Deltaproteobacteria bacterium]